MDNQVIKARFRNKLCEHMFRLKKRDADYAIACVLLDMLEVFPDVTIDEVAFLAHTSASSVTKFCKKLGYSGFAEISQPTREASIMYGWKKAGSAHPALQGAASFAAWNAEMFAFFENALPQEQLEIIAGRVASGSRVAVLSGLHGFGSANLFCELLSSVGITVLELNRSSEPDLLETLCAECELIFVISLSGQWMKEKRPRLHLDPEKLVWLTYDDAEYPVFQKIRIAEFPDQFHSVYVSATFLETFFALVASRVSALKAAKLKPETGF